MSDHTWVLENLESYHAGGLNSTERDRLEGHVAKCGACSQTLQEIRGMDDRLEGLFSASRPQPGLEDRMIRSLRIGRSNSKFRLSVIGWIGLSAAAAVILAVIGALAQHVVLVRDDSTLIAQWLLSARQRALPDNGSVKILYAKQNFGAYTPIKNAKEMFEVKEVPASEAPADAVSSADLDKLGGFALVKDIGENQPLVSGALKDKDTMGLEGKISPGTRAVAINTDATKVAGGFVLPDSHVDVYQTSPNGESKLVAQDVKVRAVDLLPTRPEDKPGRVPSTVTLEATPKQTQSLIEAQDSGRKLTLALRPFAVDNSGSMAGGNVDEMASRLRQEAVAKVDSGKAVAVSAFSPDGKKLEDGTRQIIAGQELTHDPEKTVRFWKDDNGRPWHYKQYISGGGSGPSGTPSFAGDLGGGGLGLGGLGSVSERGQGFGMGGMGGRGPVAAKPARKPPAPEAPAGETDRKEAEGKEAKKDGFGPPILSKLPHTNRLRLEETAKSGAVSEKALQEAGRVVDTYRNDAPSVAANEYFRPAEQAKTDVEKLSKELDKTIREQRVEKGEGAAKPPAKADKGVVVGLGNNAGFTAGFDIPLQAKGNQKPGKPDTAPAAPRKIVIRSGEIEFEIDSFDSAVATVTLLVNKIQGGFVDTVNSEKLPNGKVRGAVVVRVPPESLDGLVLELRKELGKSGELKGQKIGSQDITKQYTDLESRLKAARAMEERLLQVIKSGKGEIKDLLAVEKELGIWRTKIEEFEGELRYYGNLVALSTLTINLAEKEVSAPSGVIETERVQMGVEVEDVIKAQQQVLKAVEEAKGRVTKSELKQHAADQLNAVLHFEVTPEKAGPLRDRIEQLGKRTRLDIDRLQETEGGTGKPGEIKTRRKDTQFLLSLFNVANVAPRETVHLKLACVDAEDVYKKITTRVETAKGRVVTSNLNRQRNDQTSGVIQFEVKSADAGAVLLAVKELGEVMGLQVTENPDVQNVTRSKQGFNVEVFALGTVAPRETACIQLASRDVPAGYRAIQDAVTNAKGRMLPSQLNEQDKQNITAQLDFEIRRADEAAVSTAMTAAGDIFSRNVTRAADSDNVVDSKVRYQVSLINQDHIPPRETVTLGIEVGDVDKTATDFTELATASKGRAVESHVVHERNGRITAKLIFTVPLSSASTLVDKYKSAGTVRVQQLSKNPQVPESELAVARVDVTLSNAPLVATDEGFGPELRKGLSTSLRVLSLSLSFLLFGLLVVLPWALVIYAICRIIMRIHRKAVAGSTV